MESSCTRFTAAEGGARLAACAGSKNILVTEHAGFISTSVLIEHAYKIRGPLSAGSQRSVFITRASRIECVSHELSILTDLSVARSSAFDDVTDWKEELETKHILVCTSKVLKSILEKQILFISDVNVMIIDSCHLIFKDQSLQYVMKLYKQCETDKPRILAITYPLFTAPRDANEKTDSNDIINNIENENNDYVDKDGDTDDICKDKQKDVTVKDKEMDIIVKNKDKEIDIIVKDKDKEIDMIVKDKDKQIDMIVKDKEKETDIIVSVKETDMIVKVKEKEIDMTVKEKEKEIDMIVKHKDCVEIGNKKVTIDISGNNTIVDSQDECNSVKDKHSISQGIPNEQCSEKDRKIKIDKDDDDPEKVNDVGKIDKIDTAIGSRDVNDNMDDFKLYEKLEWKIEDLEEELCCDMDLAEDIDGGKRLSATLTKPRELIIEYKPRASSEALPEPYVLLDDYMRTTVSDALEFMNEHRYDPTEIYGDDMYEEFVNIPDPTDDPKNLFKEFLYVLDQLGPYAADKAAFSLLVKLEKLKIKVPYERHFLLLCLCTSVFVKIRCYADLLFSKCASDWEKIVSFSTPKVLRLAEILDQFQPPENLNETANVKDAAAMKDAKSESTITDQIEDNTAKTDDISKVKILKGSDDTTSVKNHIKCMKRSKTTELLNEIDKCDFTTLGNKIEDRVNTYEANLKDLDIDSSIPENNESSPNVANSDINIKFPLTNVKEMKCDVIDEIEIPNINLDADTAIKNKSYTIDGNNQTNYVGIGQTRDNRLNKNNEFIVGVNVDCGNKDIENKININKDSGYNYGGNKDIGNRDGGNKDIGNKDIGNKDGGNKDIGNKEGGNKDVGNKDIGNKESGNYIDTVKDNDHRRLGFGKRAGNKLKGRFRLQRNNILKIQQLQQNPDSLCGIVFVKEALMAKIMFMMIVDMSRSRRSLSYLSVQYCASEGGGERDCQREGKKQEEVLKKFRMHECNLLLATSVLEEGIDLPRCNLIVRWDAPPSYRSHGLCRSRARAPRSLVALLASAESHTDALVHNLAVYKELDQIITRKCGCGVQFEPPLEEENHADSVASIVKPYTPEDVVQSDSRSDLKSADTRFTDSKSNKRNPEKGDEKTKKDWILDHRNTRNIDLCNTGTITAVNNGIRDICKEPETKIETKIDNASKEIENKFNDIKSEVIDNNEFLINEEVAQEKAMPGTITVLYDDICKEPETKIDNKIDNTSKGIENKFNDIKSEVIDNNEFLINEDTQETAMPCVTQIINTVNVERLNNQEDNVLTATDPKDLCTKDFNDYDETVKSEIKFIDNHIDNISEEYCDNLTDEDKLNKGIRGKFVSGISSRNKFDNFGNVCENFAEEHFNNTVDSFDNKIDNIDANLSKFDNEIEDKPNNNFEVRDANDKSLDFRLLGKEIKSSYQDIKYDFKLNDCKKPDQSIASVDLNSAIALINRYCGKLPSDTFTRLAPQWWMEEVRLPDRHGTMRKAYICTLRMPLNCPVKYNIVGHPMPTRVLARRMVALQACRILHKSGELDNQLMPIGKENFKAAELETTVTCSEPDSGDCARPGTTKRRQYYFKRTAWAFTDCQAIVDSTDEEIEKNPTQDTAKASSHNMLYAIVSKLWCALPERYNTRGRRLHAPQHAPQAIGVLMGRREPTQLQIPAFPVYTRSGEVRVSVEPALEADVRLSPRRAKLIRRFMRFVFADVLRVRRRGMRLQTEGTSYNNYYVVPTVRKTRSDGSSWTDVDWPFLELIYRHTEEQKNLEIEKPIIWEQEDKKKEKEKDGKVKMENPLLKDGEVFTFDPEKYKEAVVTPWYRNQDQPQFFLVAEICWKLSPDSAFPSAQHDSFRSYYRAKYGAELTQSSQPLLDVDHTSARLNLLTPRYVNRKGVTLPVSSERTRRAKRDRLDQKQILVPELCRVHPFAAPLWFATVALPCVLYRINALLIADEIRRAVAIDVGLGIPRIDDGSCPGFQWPPLDFGWSLAEVLNADSEKTEKMKDRDDESKGDEINPEQRVNVDKENVETLEEKGEEKEKTINDILQEKLEAESGFEIGTWSNDMASSIPQTEYDEFMEPLPSNLTFCTSSSGGANWSQPIEKPKGQFNPTRSYYVADSDCSYMSSDFDTDDSDLSDCSDDDTDTSGFCNSRNTNAAMGVRIEYKTAHEAEAVDLERRKPVAPAPQPDKLDDDRDLVEYKSILRAGVPPTKYIEQFKRSVAQHEKDIKENGNLIYKDKPILNLLPEATIDVAKYYDQLNLRNESNNTDAKKTELLLNVNENRYNIEGKTDAESINPLHSISDECIENTSNKYTKHFNKISVYDHMTCIENEVNISYIKDINSSIDDVLTEKANDDVIKGLSPSKDDMKYISINSSETLVDTKIDNNLDGFIIETGSIDINHSNNTDLIKDINDGDEKNEGNIKNIDVQNKNECHNKLIKSPSPLDISNDSSESPVNSHTKNNKNYDTNKRNSQTEQNNKFPKTIIENTDITKSADGEKETRNISSAEDIAKARDIFKRESIVKNNENKYETPTNLITSKDTKKVIEEILPFQSDIELKHGQITLESIERSKRQLLAELRKSLPDDEIKKLNCFSMVDVDIDSPDYVNEKVANVGFDSKDRYQERVTNWMDSKENRPYYMDSKGQNGKDFDFDYQPDLQGHPGPSPSVILQLSTLSADASLTQVAERQLSTAAERGGRLCLFVARSALSLALTALNGTPQNEALTMSNANDGINLERLETIGDSFLKFAITAYLYCAHPAVHEGKLSHMRSKQVSNLNLYRLGRSKRLGARMIASKFEPHDNWLPPCHRPPPTLQPGVAAEVKEPIQNLDAPVDSTGCFIPYNLITQHSIPDKSIADCVEALIGAYLLECGPRGALLFMSWLGIRVLPKHDLPLPKDHPYVLQAGTRKEEERVVQKPPPPKPLEPESSDSSCSDDEEEVDPETGAPEPDWGWPGRPVGTLRPYQDRNGKWMQPIFGELKAPPSPLLRYIEDPDGELERMLSGYDALETTLQYRFRDRSLLLQALTHASHQKNRLTDCYQRLEFLGDAILDYLITRHLYEDPRRHSPGALTDLRSALVNNTIFATLAARHGFHKYFRHMSPGLNEVLTKYVKIQEENGHSISEEHYLIQEDEMEQAEDVEVPKALGDLFESVAGAIFLDSGMSLGAVWRSVGALLGAELDAFSAAAPKSPVRELLEAEPDTAKFGKPERLADGRRVRVCVEVFGRGAFKGIGRNYRIAKGTAARCALRHLRIHRPR